MSSYSVTMALLRLLTLGLCCMPLGVGAAPRRCCPDGEVMLTKKWQCSISKNHTVLACPRGRLIIDPNRYPEDRFTLTEEEDGEGGRLMKDGHIYAENDRFCVTLLLYLNETTTNEDVAFFCISDAVADADAAKARRHSTMGVLMMISVFFLVMTLLVYAGLPEMRDLEGKCLMGYVSSLGVAFLILAVLQFVGSGSISNTACATIAFLAYFWMLSVFFWLFIVSFNLWRTVAHGPPTAYTERRTFLRYCLIGWGCPLVFLLAAITLEYMPGHLDFIRPHFAQISCWFLGDLEMWSFFYGPVAVLLCCNIGFFVGTAWKLWWVCREQGATSLTSMRFKFVLYLEVFVVMGITWIFELMSAALDPQGDSAFWYATDILNALQGVLIFVITVTCRKRVLRGLSQHRTCGLPWPRRWAAGVDAESHATLPDGDMELPRTARTAGDNIVE